MENNKYFFVRHNVFVFWKEKSILNSILYSNLNCFQFFSSSGYVLHIPLPSLVVFLFLFFAVFSPFIASQAYLENKVNNCIIGKSGSLKRSSFPNSFQCLVRFLGKTIWILYIKWTETKKLISDL